MPEKKVNKASLVLNVIAVSLVLFTCTSINFDTDDNEDAPNVFLPQKEVTVTVGDSFTPDYVVTDDEDSQQELLSNVQIWTKDENGDSIELEKLTDKPGTYVIYIKVTDSDGNVSGTVKLIVIVSEDDKTPPLLTVLGPSPFLLNTGDVFHDPGAEAFDNVDGDVSGTISKSGDVDVDAEADYTLTYTVSDNTGNTASANRIVTVKNGGDTDNEKPVITLLGDDPLALLVGQTYKEPGVTAIDNIDGNITFKIVMHDTVINTSVPSTHSVYYTVEDEAGNIAIEDRTVNVEAYKDTIPPLITLLGENPISLDKGGKYTEPGATAQDNIDGDITDKVKIDKSEIDVQVPGKYTVYYSVEDAAGNKDTDERKVNVGIVDNEKPVIYLRGPDPLLIDVKVPYGEPGAYAVDNIDDTIQFKDFDVSHTIDINTLGTYKVTYKVSDASGNEATKERTVEVADTIAPVITLNGPNPVNLGLGFPYNEYGVKSATDNLDGDVTSEVKISGSVNSSVGGNYIISYKVSDSHNNEGVVERIVQVAKDTDPPVISLKGDNPMAVFLGQPYVEPGATAHDSIDGDITSEIVITGTVNENVAGDYTITYTVSDAGGNTAEKTRKVTVSADDKKPVITLKGDNPMPLKVGDTYNEPGATAVDNVDGNLTSKININSSDVNTSSAGSYEVIYTVSDNSGNTAVKKRSVVVSTDNTPPVITLKGSNPMNVPRNGNYNEPGATAHDNLDGDITNKINITGSVNTSNVGQYTITYTVTDNAGNSASKKRTVNVVEEGITVKSSDKSLTIFTIDKETTFLIPYGSNKHLVVEKAIACNIDVTPNGGNTTNFPDGIWFCNLAVTISGNTLKVVINPRNGYARFKLNWNPW